MDRSHSTKRQAWEPPETRPQSEPHQNRKTQPTLPDTEAPWSSVSCVRVHPKNQRRIAGKRSGVASATGPKTAPFRSRKQGVTNPVRKTFWHKTCVYMRSFGKPEPPFGHGMCEQNLLRRQPRLATGSADKNRNAYCSFNSDTKTELGDIYVV